MKPGSGDRVHTPDLIPLTFEISDTGVGISQEYLEKIFDPFQQAGDPNRRAEGTGLGLAISRNLVRLMGGNLEAESQPGSGSIFRFDLRFQTCGAEAAPQVSAEKIVGIKGKPSKILIVDDKAENRGLFRDLLSPAGFETAEAADGRQGFEKAEEFMPDAVITDLVMPGGDGFELIRNIRRHPALKNVIVIAASASVYEEDHRKSTAAGADAFLPKPIEVFRLFELLQRFLKVEWLYEMSEVRGAGSEDVLSPAPCIALPPAETLEKLLELAETGDVEEILNQSDILAQDETFGPFAETLRKPAKEFKINEIRRLLEEWSEESLMTHGLSLHKESDNDRKHI